MGRGAGENDGDGGDGGAAVRCQRRRLGDGGVAMTAEKNPWPGQGVAVVVAATVAAADKNMNSIYNHPFIVLIELH